MPTEVVLPLRARWIAASIASLLTIGACPARLVVAQTASSAELRIQGAVPQPLVLHADDLKAMPRTKISVLNQHEKKTENYEGVLLQALLHKAAVASGEQLRGAALASYVVAEAEDGYRVVFSIGELDSGIGDSLVLVADTVDGAPLAAKIGPFRLVVPRDKRPARWVRMLRTITVVTAEPQPQK